ncbi:MAG: GPR endopeptidase [Limnochordales bacterium]|nr:GPR endopeptidase [Limnochordales bacterium]
MVSDWSRAWRARALLRPPLVGFLQEEALDLPEDEWARRYGIRTDLAIEAREVVIEREGAPEIPGVIVKREPIAGGTLLRVDIESDIGSRLMGKVKGRYVTLEVAGLREHNPTLHEKVAAQVGAEIRRFIAAMQLSPEAPVLLVGLGNWNATPDALGPKVVGHAFITRHLFRYAPPQARQGFRPVAAVAPGVLGLTGLETSEIVEALVARFKPALVLCVDALAARTVERLGTTIQISDAGISPGSGVGNRRKGITQADLGVPVLVIGAPTVIGAMTIVSDAWERLAGRGASDLPATARPAPAAAVPGSPVEASGLAAGAPGWSAGGPRVRDGIIPGPGEAGKEETLRTLLGPYLGTMIVTPKEVDSLIDDLAAVIAAGINVGLHPGFTLEEAFDTLQ